MRVGLSGPVGGLGTLLAGCSHPLAVWLHSSLAQHVRTASCHAGGDCTAMPRASAHTMQCTQPSHAAGRRPARAPTPAISRPLTTCIEHLHAGPGRLVAGDVPCLCWVCAQRQPPCGGPPDEAAADPIPLAPPASACAGGPPPAGYRAPRALGQQPLAASAVCMALLRSHSRGPRAPCAAPHAPEASPLCAAHQPVPPLVPARRLRRAVQLARTQSKPARVTLPSRGRRPASSFHRAPRLCAPHPRAGERAAGGRWRWRLLAPRGWGAGGPAKLRPQEANAGVPGWPDAVVGAWQLQGVSDARFYAHDLGVC